MATAALTFTNLQDLSAEEAPLKDHEVEFFETKIRPVLIKHCYECHAADAKSIRGGLLLDTRAGTLQGGDSGPSVVPGKPEESMLLESLRFESYEMPPSGKLSDEIIQDFETWIKMGAPDPRKGESKVVSQQIDLEQGRQFWSFQPVKQSNPPQVTEQAWKQSP
ncbi:MAG: c-type cytochrome domain-containing protein, partial [Gimesia chilikensis]